MLKKKKNKTVNKPSTSKASLPATIKKPNGRGKWVLLGLGVAATGALSYFGYQYWNKRKKKSETPDVYTNTTKEETYPPPKYHAPKQATPKETATKLFPLVKGSKGDLIKTFQEALIAKHGKAILPKYGADGDFGSEMVTALAKLNLPNTISETTYNLYVKGASPDHATVAKELYNAALTKNFNKAIGLLKTLRNADDYKAVSDTFVNYRIGTVRQTLVNGMLNSFADAKQKDAIRLAFSNMGLKYDGNKWALSGIDGDVTLITIQPTQVWKTPKHYVSVPSNMVLGKKITTKGNYTLFENEQQYFLVETNHVKPYEN
ncbi:MAG: hypothetical protein H0U95_05005 [Bacteroidetes bacterium]|nr:hypothetical protein [Bacteroidota bacterium]